MRENSLCGHLSSWHYLPPTVFMDSTNHGTITSATLQTEAAPASLKRMLPRRTAHPMKK